VLINAKSANLSEKVASIYGEDLGMERLKIQLRMFPDVVKVTPMDGIHIKEVTCVQTLCQVLNIQPSFKILLTEVHKLLRIYLTIPATTSTAGRNFSALQRIKTYLRTSMSQARLNHCIILHVLRERVDELEIRTLQKNLFKEMNDVGTILDNFKCSQRMHVFNFKS